MGAEIKYGPQPVKALITQQEMNIAQLARDTGVKFNHMYHAISGRVSPNVKLREELPKIFGVSLEELFTPESLGYGTNLTRVRFMAGMNSARDAIRTFVRLGSLTDETAVEICNLLDDAISKCSDALQADS